MRKAQHLIVFLSFIPTMILEMHPFYKEGQKAQQSKQFKP